jgi:hypothetical protein
LHRRRCGGKTAEGCRTPRRWRAAGQTPGLTPAWDFFEAVGVHPDGVAGGENSPRRHHAPATIRWTMPALRLKLKKELFKGRAEQPSVHDLIIIALRVMVKSIHIVMRSVLAVLVCVLAWLCVHAALATEQLKHDVLYVYRDTPESHLSGFIWQHPVVLSVFAVCIGLAALAHLAFSKSQCRAVAVGLVIVAVLLVQWLVVTPAVDKPAMQMLEKLNTLGSQ